MVAFCVLSHLAPFSLPTMQALSCAHQAVSPPLITPSFEHHNRHNPPAFIWLLYQAAHGFAGCLA